MIAVYRLKESTIEILQFGTGLRMELDACAPELHRIQPGTRNGVIFRRAAGAVG
jgi:hypothetical protein